jgi:hypothetical protein
VTTVVSVAPTDQVHASAAFGLASSFLVKRAGIVAVTLASKIA